MKEKKEPTKSLRIYEHVHDDLRVYVATHKTKITEFVSSIVSKAIKQKTKKL